MRYILLILLLSFQANGQMYFGRIASGGSEEAPVDTLIGPSITWSGKTTVFLGDSWTVGIAASDNAHRYTTLFAAGKSTTESNSGVSGTTMSPDSCASYIYYALTWIPTYNSGTHCALFINLGLNDIGKNVNYQSSTRFDSAYNAYVNYAINTKGWPANRIYLFTPGWCPDYTAWTGACGISAANSARAIAFNAKIQALASSYGCNYVDIYTPMSTALNTSYYDVGKAHLNDTGMAWLSTWLLAHIR